MIRLARSGLSIAACTGRCASLRALDLVTGAFLQVEEELDVELCLLVVEDPATPNVWILRRSFLKEKYHDHQNYS